MADTLRASIRPDDVVARLGGDEFAVLLTRLPDATKAESVAVQLLARCDTGHTRSTALSSPSTPASVSR